jgi:hypothetical protein
LGYSFFALHEKGKTEQLIKKWHNTKSQKYAIIKKQVRHAEGPTELTSSSMFKNQLN